MPLQQIFRRLWNTSSLRMSCSLLIIMSNGSKRSSPISMAACSKRRGATLEGSTGCGLRSILSGGLCVSPLFCHGVTLSSSLPVAGVEGGVSSNLAWLVALSKG